MRFIKKSGDKVIVETDQEELEFFFDLADQAKDGAAKEIASLLKFAYPPAGWVTFND